MNIFDTMKVYAEGWTLVDTKPFSEEEKALIKSAVVVQSAYGLSVCFLMVAGGKCYKPVSKDSTLSLNQIVDLDKVQIQTLRKQGEKDIYRIL